MQKIFFTKCTNVMEVLVTFLEQLKKSRLHLCTAVVGLRQETIHMLEA